MQQFKQIAEKVLSAVQSGMTDAVTGDDMAQFIKAMDTDDLFANGQIVRKIVN
jgi:hypothetical protein